MSQEQWYYIGTIRLYQITFDVVKLFGVYFIREHYKQISWRTGKEIKRTWTECHPESDVVYLIEAKFQPRDVFQLLNGLAVSRAMNEVSA